MSQLHFIKDEIVPGEGFKLSFTPEENGVPEDLTGATVTLTEFPVYSVVIGPSSLVTLSIQPANLVPGTTYRGAVIINWPDDPPEAVLGIELKVKRAP